MIGELHGWWLVAYGGVMFTLGVIIEKLTRR
jgi:hypothetical protein